jgi:hypothetical protein
MPGLPDLILKAPVFARLEKLSRDGAFWQNEAIRDHLNQTVVDLSDTTNTAKSILAIAKSAWLYDKDSTQHFEQHWLNSAGGGYWKNMQSKVDAVLRAGMKRACEVFIARNYAVPFEYFWVISGDTSSDRWEMSISEGLDQVTVIFHTPQTPAVYTKYIENPKMSIARYDTASSQAVVVPVRVPVP